MVAVPHLGFIITGALLATIASDTTLRVVPTPRAVRRREKWPSTRRAAILEGIGSYPLSGLSPWQLIAAPWLERETLRLG